MSPIVLLRATAVACVLSVVGACTQRTSAGASLPSKSEAWTARGSTACETYLTSAVVAEILKNPSGEAKPLSHEACTYKAADFSSITITLMPSGLAGLDAHLPFLPDPVPVAGIGDKAVRTMVGIEAAKGTDRMCVIHVTPPFAVKLSGVALAQNLGAICNALFALP